MLLQNLLDTLNCIYSRHAANFNNSDRIDILEK